MIVPSVIRDIALAAAKQEYRLSRKLGASSDDALKAGVKVMADIRSIAAGGRQPWPVLVPVPADWWMGS